MYQNEVNLWLDQEQISASGEPFNIWKQLYNEILNDNKPTVISNDANYLTFSVKFHLFELKI